MPAGHVAGIARFERGRFGRQELLAQLLSGHRTAGQNPAPQFIPDAAHRAIMRPTRMASAFTTLVPLFIAISLLYVDTLSTKEKRGSYVTHAF
jgi:hypothetical protein